MKGDEPMTFAHLTKPSGRELALNPFWVSAVERDEVRELTKVEVGSGLYFWVKEPVEQVIARCESGADR